MYHSSLTRQRFKEYPVLIGHANYPKHLSQSDFKSNIFALLQSETHTNGEKEDDSKTKFMFFDNQETRAYINCAVYTAPFYTISWFTCYSW